MPSTLVTEPVSRATDESPHCTLTQASNRHNDVGQRALRQICYRNKTTQSDTAFRGKIDELCHFDNHTKTCQENQQILLSITNETVNQKNIQQFRHISRDDDNILSRLRTSSCSFPFPSLRPRDETTGTRRPVPWAGMAPSNSLTKHGPALSRCSPA